MSKARRNIRNGQANSAKATSDDFSYACTHAKVEVFHELGDLYGTYERRR